VYEPEVQRSYGECAEGYGFKIDACPPRDPQKKGIVESGVKYIKGSFLPLREFRDLADANRQLHEWVMGTAGNRVHGTTREAPLTRFASVERSLLTALPDVPPHPQIAGNSDLRLRINSNRADIADSVPNSTLLRSQSGSSDTNTNSCAVMSKYAIQIIARPARPFFTS